MRKDNSDEILKYQRERLKDFLAEVDTIMDRKNLNDEQIEILQSYKLALEKAVAKLIYYYKWS